jgi:hypothetical protein
VGPAVPLPKELCFPTTVISGEIAEFGLKKQKPNVSGCTFRLLEVKLIHLLFLMISADFGHKKEPYETD